MSSSGGRSGSHNASCICKRKSYVQQLRPHCDWQMQEKRQREQSIFQLFDSPLSSSIKKNLQNYIWSCVVSQLDFFSGVGGYGFESFQKWQGFFFSREFSSNKFPRSLGSWVYLPQNNVAGSQALGVSVLRATRVLRWQLQQRAKHLLYVLIAMRSVSE